MYKGGEARRLLEAIEKHRAETHKRIRNMSFNLDPDTCSPEMLDKLLKLQAWTAKIDLTERQKRKLVKAVSTIHSLGGTAKGIVVALRYILGVEVSVREYLKIRYETDGSTYQEDDERNWTFDVLFPLGLRADDVAVAKVLVEYMMAPNTYYKPAQLLANSNTHTKQANVKIIVKRPVTQDVYDPEGVEGPPATLILDGTWKLNGQYDLWGYKTIHPEKKSKIRHEATLIVKDSAGNTTKEVILG